MRHLTVYTLFVVIAVWGVALSAVPAKAQQYQRTTLVVENLVCTSCFALIEAKLQKIPGVLGMRVDLQSGTVVADHSLRISGKQLAEAVSSFGYSASFVKQEPVVGSEVNGFSNSFARCGVSGCSTGGCNATAAAWKELYRRFVR